MKYPWALCLAVLLLVSGCGESSAPTRSNQFVPLTSIEISSANPNPFIARGTTNQFTAIGNFSGLFTRDITAEVAWSSDDPAVLSFANGFGISGLASGVGAGSAEVSAALDGISASTAFTVTDAQVTSISLAPADASRPRGLTSQFTATGTFDDGSTQNLTFDATWASDTPAFATISDAIASKGLATAVAEGTATISATFDGVTGTTTLTVTAPILETITVTPANPTIPNLTTQQFTATGNFSDGTTVNLTSQVSWASSNPALVTIDTAGVASALAGGTVTISASLDGITGSTGLTVSGAALASITVSASSPPTLTIADGTTVQFIALGSFADGNTDDITSQVTWDSSNPAVASISNSSGSRGLATAEAPGSTTITASLGNVRGQNTLSVTGAILQSITIDPLNASIADDTTRQFTATGNFSDGNPQGITRDVTWSSSNPNVATISNSGGTDGLATALAPGVTTITATFNGVSAATNFTVTSAVITSITISPGNQTLLDGDTRQLRATGSFSDATSQEVTELATWSSSNTSVATVSTVPGSKGEVEAVAPGTATITAEFGGITATTLITVN